MAQWFINNSSNIATIIGASVNAYTGYNEFIAGSALAMNVEAAPVTTITGGYMMADGMWRMVSAVAQVGGALQNDKYLSRFPSNLPGLIGFFADNNNNGRYNLTSGGGIQTTFEILGDFGLSKAKLIQSVEKMITSPTFLNQVDVIYRIVSPYVSPIIKSWSRSQD